MVDNKYTPNNKYTEIDDESEYYLKEISRWARFIAVVGFILIGIMAIGVFTSSALVYCMSEHASLSAPYPYNPGTINWLHLIIYFCMLIAYFFPVYYLYKFSVRIRAGVKNKDSVTIAESFRFLRNHYMMIGTLTLIGLIFLTAFFGYILVDIIRCFG